MRTEAELLRAIAQADTLKEKQALMADLNALRAKRTAKAREDRELDLANTHVESVLTPVSVHERTTDATDWLIDEAPTRTGSFDHDMRTEATLWFRKVSREVKADREEFAEQAQGMASMLAGQYGDNYDKARRAFLDHAGHLHRLAEDENGDEDDESPLEEAIEEEVEEEVSEEDFTSEDDSDEESDEDDDDDEDDMDKESLLRRRGYVGRPLMRHSADGPPGEIHEPKGEQSGHGESTVTDYDTEADQEPMFGDEWDGERDTGSEIGSGHHPPIAADGEEMTEARRRTAASQWYDEGYSRGQGLANDGISLDEAPDPLSGEWAGESIPEIFGSWEAATDEAMDDYERGYYDALAGDPKQATRKSRLRKRAEKTCETCGDAIAQTDGDWHHDNGEKHDHEAKPSSDSKESVRKTAQDGWREEGDGSWTYSADGGAIAGAVSQGSALEGDDAWTFDVLGPSGRQYMSGFSSAEDAKQAAEQFLVSLARHRAFLRKRAEQTCEVCGDSIEKDDSSEDPQTYHHNNGEKHDHEAKPSSDSKESRRRVTAAFNFGGSEWYTGFSGPQSSCIRCGNSFDHVVEAFVRAGESETASDILCRWCGKEVQGGVEASRRVPTRGQEARRRLPKAGRQSGRRRTAGPGDVHVFDDPGGARYCAVEQAKKTDRNDVSGLSAATKRIVGPGAREVFVCNDHINEGVDYAETGQPYWTGSRTAYEVPMLDGSTTKVGEGQYLVVDTNTEEVQAGPFSTLEEASAWMTEIGHSYPRDHAGGVPLAVADDTMDWRRASQRQAAPPWKPQVGDRVKYNDRFGEVVDGDSWSGGYTIELEDGTTIGGLTRGDLKKASKQAQQEGAGVVHTELAGSLCPNCEKGHLKVETVEIGGPLVSYYMCDYCWATYDTDGQRTGSKTAAGYFATNDGEDIEGPFDTSGEANEAAKAYASIVGGEAGVREAVRKTAGSPRDIEPGEPFQVGDEVRIVGGFEDGITGTISRGGWYESSTYGYGPMMAWYVEVGDLEVGPFRQINLDKVE